MNAIFFNQFEWTNNMIEVPNKIIINDIIVSLNTHIKDVVIAEVLTDYPLLIIKENINYGNFLNNDRFNFLSLIHRVIFQKWHTKITLVINKEFSLIEIALIDSGVDMNCIQE